ncbi:protein MULTIPOLAR SPINDLE 1 isoform X1 [Rhodamnia argentea]|uniref:Protein MULTIPOLAR SPINDLE 1 isoform X1 n=1 Tax=Rhodamnia argentea TaxID=178133 RepID=A0ABM3HAV4_9MYRT|nr:protein MULTIPOLAR SPINDLE 1 isoform X1 [Rhodamnia argentea]
MDECTVIYTANVCFPQLQSVIGVSILLSMTLIFIHLLHHFVLGRDDIGNDVQFYVQHLIRKLGKAVYLGQRALVAVSQKIPVIAESVLFSDPFDDKFPDLHQYMFILIQLLEFLVSDYLLTWSRDENFDQLLFEEWLTSIIHARKALGVLESSNGLYMLYMDRVVGELARQLGQISSDHKLNPDVLTNLFL